MSIHQSPHSPPIAVWRAPATDLPAISTFFTHETRRRLLICLLLLAILMLWAVIWPQTGDGDAIMHFLNARDGLSQPAKLMGSWARVGSKLPLLLPAQLGILAARWTSALISILCAWQTIRLADDLKLRRAWLAAPLLLFQPFVFTYAGDTMTEMPLALGLVIAIRLWWARRPLASCLVIGYLPTVRPEGFFLVAMWGVLILATPRLGTPRRRALLVPVLGWGILAWFIACWILRDDPTYFFRQGWSWPADSLRVYGRGSFFAHINRWPLYCGPILFPLFILGLDRLRHRPFFCAAAAILLILELTVPGFIREIILPWPTLILLGLLAWARRREKIAIAWWALLLIFSLHTILWWRGWFGSCGLMRILACAAPITAVICLRGWNVAAHQLTTWRLSHQTIRAAGIAALAAMALWAMAFYLVEPLHQRIFALQRACDFARDRDLLTNAPEIILGDPMVRAYLRMAPNPPNLMPHNCNRSVECARLLNAPIGSAGFWDNQHAQSWFNVAPSDLPILGFTVLYEVHQTAIQAIQFLEPAIAPRQQIYLVIRKDHPGRLPPGVPPVPPGN